MVLESLNVWPDNDSFVKRSVIILTIISLAIMEAAQIAYVFMNITDMSKILHACTTVLTTFESMAKLTTLIYYRGPLNEIVSVIWKDFWPANVTSRRCQRAIKFRSDYITIIAVTFLLVAFVSCAEFVSYPLIENQNQLAMGSWYPFDFRASPTFEVMCIWQWFMTNITIVALSGFDSFFNAIVMICATQFIVLREVLEGMGSSNAAVQHVTLFAGEDKRRIGAMDVLVKICRLVESTMSHIVFLQFLETTMSVCISCVVVIVDPSTWKQMVSYVLAHLLQFFIYCSVGNELTHQSGKVADSAYMCDWESSQDLNFRKGLILIVQRAQRPETLTVAGLMQLNLANFVSTLQLSFSFYTLLNSFL